MDALMKNATVTGFHYLKIIRIVYWCAVIIVIECTPMITIWLRQHIPFIRLVQWTILSIHIQQESSIIGEIIITVEVITMNNWIV